MLWAALGACKRLVMPIWCFVSLHIHRTSLQNLAKYCYLTAKLLIMDVIFHTVQKSSQQPARCRNQLTALAPSSLHLQEDNPAHTQPTWHCNCNESYDTDRIWLEMVQNTTVTVAKSLHTIVSKRQAQMLCCQPVNSDKD